MPNIFNYSDLGAVAWGQSCWWAKWWDGGYELVWVMSYAIQPHVEAINNPALSLVAEGTPPANVSSLSPWLTLFTARFALG